MKRARALHETSNRKNNDQASKLAELILQNGAVVPEHEAASNDSHKLCDRCQALDLERMFDDLPLHRRSDGSIVPKRIMRIGHLSRDEETSPCPLCRFFACSRLYWGHAHHHYVWKLPLSYGGHTGSERASDTPFPLFPLRQVLVVASCPSSMNFRKYLRYVSQFEFSSSLYRHNGLIAPLEPARHSHELSLRRRSDYIDLKLIRSWISDCNEYHDSYHNRCGQLAPFDDVTVPIQAMDCSTAQIHNISHDTKYAALSYVWGNNATVPDTGEDPIPSTHGLPRLIEDAMVVANSLGLRYLWVDRYCISTSDPIIRHEQIKQMDLIYGRAEVTIISLADNPTFGLPGVSIPRTKVQPGLSAGGRVFLSTMPPPHCAIRASKWWTRAWTFQEATLSRRRLYFTSDQAYFECRRIHHCETIMPLHPEIESRTYHGPWGRMVTTMGIQFNLRNLYNLLFDYFGRQMTYETDTINAFQGVFQLFERRGKIQHFYGLPFLVNHQTSFLKSLLWRAKCTSRQPGFPSWSWAGWRGKNLRFDEALDCEDDLKASGMQVWAKPSESSLNRDLRLTHLDDSQIPLSSLSPCLKLRAPTAQLEFLSPIDGTLVSSPTQCLPDWYSVAPFMTWVRNDENARCYLDIEKNQFPTIQVLDAYKSYVVILVGWKDRTCILLILGETFSGKNERVGVVFLDLSHYDMLGFSQKVAEKYNLPKDTDLGLLDTTYWEIKEVDLE